MKRTLARCKKFEDTGKSCFMDPVIKDVLFAAPAYDNCAVSIAGTNLPQTQNSEREAIHLGMLIYP